MPSTPTRNDDMKREQMRVDYSRLGTPAGYKCDRCGAVGCKLWREYQTFADHTLLLCCDCAAKDQEKDIGSMGHDGRYENDYGKSDQIGWYVPAVPTEDGDAFWGYTSVPEAGCKWWYSLPLRANS
ncbi:hypothetical protein A3C96_02125 [Candidatus Uhrbacteria bacterium RIFCSPHIGHO2_02_FULL_60_10]|uniref:Uncharacterized protein n=1 Tax=Candidatus Uhrbacteria bacterium RIFCSPHIGHO2_02_FULL_60_10 TaxID=1802392 RepID=A0A1F7U8K6_9BACT|nr:MAG: hypothetical protein A3C96_02125 [Candidatus Uhrbacteria bacterium RIFCSPHIGHO2_02_FULL_60_10]